MPKRKKKQNAANPGDLLRIELPVTKVTHPHTSVEAQENRLRAVFGLGNGDTIPDVNEDTLLVFYRHLTTRATFPFKAKHSVEIGPLDVVSHRITVLGIIDPGKHPDEDHGLFCTARLGRRKIEMPLASLNVEQNDLRTQVCDDYAYWFENYR
jgi:hypothetical protein